MEEAIIDGLHDGFWGVIEQYDAPPSAALTALTMTVLDQFFAQEEGEINHEVFQRAVDAYIGMLKAIQRLGTEATRRSRGVFHH
ncbi:MAG: hypothetical protein U1E81_13735 [Xanthobacteraceae bacterium]